MKVWGKESEHFRQRIKLKISGFLQNCSEWMVRGHPRFISGGMKIKKVCKILSFGNLASGKAMQFIPKTADSSPVALKMDACVPLQSAVASMFRFELYQW